jgi:hypothetical protein
LNEQSQGEQLVRAIVNFPKYFAGFLLGFFVIVLVELDMTALLLAAVALGFAVDSVFWGVFFFLVAWVLLRTLSPLMMIGQAIQNVANNIILHANRMANRVNPPPPIQPPHE